MIIKFLCGIIVVEAITELITKSEIFSPIREFFFNRRDKKFFNFIFNALDCAYCSSVWVGFFIATLYLTGIYENLTWLFYGLILHRMSNLFHFMIDLFKVHSREDFGPLLEKGKDL
jgi:Na+/H+ antiporter NhaB